MEKRFQFRHVNELTGLFVLGVLALVIAGVVLSGHSQQWFAAKYSFAVRLPEEGAAGLRRGATVYILGVPAGLVKNIRVGQDGRITAQVKTQRDFERFVRIDSTATIKKVFGVAGDSFLEIARGTGAALPAHQPEIICLASEDSFGRMEKMLAELRAELIPLVKRAGGTFEEWTKLGGDLQKNGEQLRQFIGRLDYLAAGVELGKGTAGKLLNDTGLADDAQKLLQSAQETMGDMRGMVTNLNDAVANVQKGAARLPEITDAIAQEAHDLPGLVQQTQDSMREVERLITALQRHWLVRRYVNKDDPALPSHFHQGAPRQPALKPLRSPKESNR
jgi:phospholipid/cholesterol/gamma-HCH transport system substrate-binding protein